MSMMIIGSRGGGSSGRQVYSVFVQYVRDKRSPTPKNETVSRVDFELLRQKYGGFASWAIWDPRDKSDESIINRCQHELNARTVMVGLNISAPLTVPWSNFHIGRNDRKLEFAFNESEFRGAYMTDLIKAEVEVSSAELMRRIRNGSINIGPHLAFFRQEMADVGATGESNFILFGSDVKNLFRQHLNDLFPNQIAVRHYAVYGSAEDWTAEFRQIASAREYSNLDYLPPDR
jgi:hypothetical protein